jgi:filamentous hemagglutinin
VLTLRASGDLNFYGSLSDGFFQESETWLAPLLAHNPLLPANSQSWSYRLVAGADLVASSYRALLPASRIDRGTGFVRLGRDAGGATVTGGADARTAGLVPRLHQVIRTGSGDIDIHAAGSFQLLNPFAAVYTAGTQVADPTMVNAPGDFVIPNTSAQVQQGNLGAQQQPYDAQYSMAGGSVSITAGGNIERLTRNNDGLIADSSRQLPNNWLYRRGAIGPDGNFASIAIGSGFTETSDPAASTSWWIDFSNFFQGVGALGGGNLSLRLAAASPTWMRWSQTNARAASGRPSASAIVELGGGDLSVRSGNDISGGVYYVERGTGSLVAGGSITTNATRSPSFGLVSDLNNPDSARLDPVTWMPTTLFVGKSSFDLSAAGDLLLGPVANPFLLPQGVNNQFWYKSYFSTLSPDSKVTATSLGGDVSVRTAVTLPSLVQAQPMLRAWHESQLVLTGSASSTSWLQPWLRLAETNLAPFAPVWSLTAPGLSLASLSGSVNLTGELTLSPAPNGQLEILAASSIHALQPTGLSTIRIPGQTVTIWESATINLSDANPGSIPKSLSPLTQFLNFRDGLAIPSNETGVGFMDGLAALFTESGSTSGINAVLQTRQARHTRGGLHSGDLEPLRMVALNGDLSGLTVFSAKMARISAAMDITDVSLYIQNLRNSDVSVVTAGRDIVAFDTSSPLRVLSTAPGNLLSFGQLPVAGDIQISGPGSLQVIAGRGFGSRCRREPAGWYGNGDQLDWQPAQSVSSGEGGGFDRHGRHRSGGFVVRQRDPL